MRVKCKHFPLFIVLAMSEVFAWMPAFTSGIGMDTVKVDGVSIADNNDSIVYPSPTFADWDGDGLDDMILGYWEQYATGINKGEVNDGKLRFLKNVGQKGAPEFTDKGDLYAGGSLITLEAG